MQRNKRSKCADLLNISRANIFTCLDDALCCFFQQYFDSSAVCVFYKTCTWMYKFSLKVFLPSSASDKNWIVMASMPKKNSEIWNVSRNVSQLKFFRISEGLSKSYCSFVRFSTEGCLWSYWNILIFRPLKVEMHCSKCSDGLRSKSIIEQQS